MKTFTADINGVEVLFSTEDRYSNLWFYPRYAGGRIHEKPVTEMMLEAIRGAECFVDVGANLGWYTCLASKHMPNGTVHGFEMDDLNFALLERNLAINKCDNVEVHHMAVSESSGVVGYNRKANRPSPGFRLKSISDEQKSSESVWVSSTSLDDYLDKRNLVPDVVKIDVEGAEMNVLMGMRRTLRERRPTLFLEIHPDNLPSYNTTTSAVLAKLIQCKYLVFEIESLRGQEEGMGLKLLEPESVLDKNTMLYARGAV